MTHDPLCDSLNPTYTLECDCEKIDLVRYDERAQISDRVANIEIRRFPVLNVVPSFTLYVDSIFEAIEGKTRTSPVTSYAEFVKQQNRAPRFCLHYYWGKFKQKMGLWP